jgi:O-antigen ligase
VALAQVGIGLAARHGTPPRLLMVPAPRARMLLAGATVLAVAGALAVGTPSRLSHAWQQFKSPSASAGAAGSITRFGSASGEGRYQYWQVGVRATSSGGHLLGGSGPGSFQLVWLPRATVPGYITDAHSLYVETLAEVGIIGLALLGGFLLLALAGAVVVVLRSKYEARTRAAGAAAALVAFMVSAIVDWVWQLPVLPAAVLLLAAAVLAPARDLTRARRAPLSVRPLMIVAAIACLIAIAIPLAMTTDVRQSQAAASTGNPAAALTDANSAARLEPGAASPEIQKALVLEAQRDYPSALAAASAATRDEPQNWSAWLIRSRLEAETNHVKTSIADFERARSLNPRSPLFHS